MDLKNFTALAQEKEFKSRMAKVKESSQGIIDYIVAKGCPAREIKETYRSVIEDKRHTESMVEYVKFGDYEKFKNEIKVIVDSYIETEEYLDPKTNLSTGEMIQTLREHVVRIVFNKKSKPQVEGNQVNFGEGTRRVMYATRNPDLIKLYDNEFRSKGVPPSNIDNVQAIERQIERDYIKVLDLQKGAWRTFKPSTLMDHDTIQNVSSWLVFDIENDNWWEMAKIKEQVNLDDSDEYTEKDPKPYIHGKGFEDVYFSHTNPDRKVFENTLLEEAKETGIVLSKAEILLRRHNRQQFIIGEDSYQQVLTGTYQTQEVIEIHKQIKDFTRNLGQNVNTNLHIKKGKPRIRGGNNYSVGSYEVMVGMNQFVFSPFYIVNADTGYVFLDRYNIFNFNKGTPKDIDLEKFYATDVLLTPYIEEFIRSSGILNIEKPAKRYRVLTERDIIRLKRLEKIAELRKAKQKEVLNYLDTLGITNIQFEEARGVFKITFKIEKKYIHFLVNSRVIEWQNPNTKEFSEIVSSDANSLLKNYQYSLLKLARKYPDRVITIVTRNLITFLCEDVFNLRKKFQNIFKQYV